MKTKATEIHDLGHLLCEMANIVLKKMDCRQTDFFIFDVQSIDKAFNNTGEPQLVWIVRDTGTHLFKINDDDLKECVAYLLKYHKNKMDIYFISKNKLILLNGKPEEIIYVMSPDGFLKTVEGYM